MANPKKRKKREKFCEDLWNDIDFSGLAESMNEPDTGTKEAHQYIDGGDPNDGYHVRGIGPVTWKVTNPECDAY